MSFVRDILNKAADTIDQRAQERDVEQERSMKATVDAFNALTGESLTEAQGWLFMRVLKMARSENKAYREDDFVDGAAYCALQAEARKAEG